MSSLKSDLAAAAGEMEHVRPAGAGASGARPGCDGNLVEGQVFAELADNAQPVQEVEGAILLGDILAAPDEPAAVIAKSFTKLEDVAGGEAGIPVIPEA